MGDFFFFLLARGGGGGGRCVISQKTDAYVASRESVVDARGCRKHSRPPLKRTIRRS